MSVFFENSDAAGDGFADMILKLPRLLGRCRAWRFGLWDRTQLDIQATTPPHGTSPPPLAHVWSLQPPLWEISGA